MTADIYQSPLQTRYSSEKMLRNFSPTTKYKTWRKLWIALAEAQKELGLDIKADQITELKAKVDEISFDKVKLYEKELKHDVMAHIHAYGDLCPSAKSIIHLGATSCFVTDNGDLIQFKNALHLLLEKVIQVIRNFSRRAREFKSLPVLGYTHFQPAQPTTLGKRICLWLQDFMMDYKQLSAIISNLPFLGLKGATGTQASILALFDNNTSKVEECDQLLAGKFGFKKLLSISAQTYPRKIDAQITQCLSQIAISAQKFATDMRLLCHTNELAEPRKSKQVGSSAMPYKQNPIFSERICSLSRFQLSLCRNAEETASSQWLERTLDDSANRRLALPEAFLTTDAVLNLVIFLSNDFRANKSVIENHLQRELPFMATENILMRLVKKGGNRQNAHEALRIHSEAAKKRIFEEGAENNLLKSIADDPDLPLSSKELKEIVNISEFVGLAQHQVEKFLKEDIEPILERNSDLKVSIDEINV